MFKEYFEKLLGQLARELNCKPEDLLKSENTVTVSDPKEGSRQYHPGKPFLQMATVGSGTVITADERLHGFLKDLVKDREGHRLFEHGCLEELDAELKKYGFMMLPTHHMFLPSCHTETDGRFEVRWYIGDEIGQLYGDPRFTHAISYPEPNPFMPDRMAVTALDGDKIMGMAGCSEDGPHWQQIGIDVLPEYRGRGLGTYLVTLLKNRLTEMGDVPFYGTAPANIFSQKIALSSGFRPAWVETEAKPIN